MKSGPTPISAGIAGTPLSNQAIDSKKNSNQPAVADKSSPAIRDTLETSDSEPNGQMPDPEPEPDEPQDYDTRRIDLTG